MTTSRKCPNCPTGRLYTNGKDRDPPQLRCKSCGFTKVLNPKKRGRKAKGKQPLTQLERDRAYHKRQPRQVKYAIVDPRKLQDAQLNPDCFVAVVTDSSKRLASDRFPGMLVVRYLGMKKKQQKWADMAQGEINNVYTSQPEP